jgi:acetyltransferase-like isoleucine patch superfamily enzyme
MDRIRQLVIPYRVKLFKKINEYLIESQHHTLKKNLKYCGERIHFYLPLHISAPNNLEIGEDSTVGTYVHMWCQGGISIGKRVMIGSHVAITSVTHDYSCPDMRFAPAIHKPVIIEDDVWIGAHSVILPGAKIGKGAVIGANSVVTKDVEPCSIVVGSPARLYKFRELENASLTPHSLFPSTEKK